MSAKDEKKSLTGLFSLKTKVETFNLSFGQSPRGLRSGNHRPYQIEMKIEGVVDRKQLSQLIQYLITLETTLER